jgi:C4-type Zn-finger protein
MPYQVSETSYFGAEDRPACPNCGDAMRLRNRRPDAAYGFRFERQTFTCGTCNFRVERSVDVDGKSPELLRY